MSKKTAKEAAKEDGMEKKEGAAADAAPADKKDDGAEHPDAAQDKELIKKMIAKHVGGGSADSAQADQNEEKKEGDKESKMSEEEAALAKEAYEAHKEMGSNHEEAVEKAADALALAKHMHSKKEGADKKDAPAPAEKDDAKAEPPEQKEEKKAEADMEKKESNKIIELTAENAKLKEENRAFKAVSHLEKICIESKLPMSATKAFRGLEAVKNAKTEKELDMLLGVFKESFKTAGVASEPMYDFVVSTEKTAHKESKGKGLDFSDCVKN